MPLRVPLSAYCVVYRNECPARLLNSAGISRSTRKRRQRHGTRAGRVVASESSRNTGRQKNKTAVARTAERKSILRAAMLIYCNTKSCLALLKANSAHASELLTQRYTTFNWTRWRDSVGVRSRIPNDMVTKQKTARRALSTSASRSTQGAVRCALGRVFLVSRHCSAPCY